MQSRTHFVGATICPSCCVSVGLCLLFCVACYFVVCSLLCEWKTSVREKRTDDAPRFACECYGDFNSSLGAVLHHSTNGHEIMSHWTPLPPLLPSQCWHARNKRMTYVAREANRSLVRRWCCGSPLALLDLLCSPPSLWWCCVPHLGSAACRLFPCGWYGVSSFVFELVQPSPFSSLCGAAHQTSMRTETYYFHGLLPFCLFEV